MAGLTDIRLRDLPSFFLTTDPNDIMLNLMLNRIEYVRRAPAIILNTFDDLERDSLSALRSLVSNIYTVGPLPPLSRHLPSSASIGSNLLKEDSTCISWLDDQEDNSVIYVNYGSITVMNSQQLVEFEQGLNDSGHPYLWVIRPDLVSGFLYKKKKNEKKSLVVEWCDQKAVLAHRAVGGFLTHCGWNSTLESVYEGVPMICWPFFAEQPTNCRYSCRHWGVGVDMGGEVRRGRVEEVVRELMGEGEKGREVRRRALEWGEKARRAIGVGGSSWENLERLVRDLGNMKRSSS